MLIFSRELRVASKREFYSGDRRLIEESFMIFRSRLEFYRSVYINDAFEKVYAKGIRITLEPHLERERLKPFSTDSLLPTIAS